MNFQYGDIIFLAAIAVYLLFRLIGVIGKKEDQSEIDRLKTFGKAPEKKPENDLGRYSGLGTSENSRLELGLKTISMKNAPEESKDEFVNVPVEVSAQNGIREIKEADSNFSLSRFVQGAKIAFEMVLQSYSKNDKETLKNLFPDDISKKIEQKIILNAERGVTETKTLVSVVVKSVEGAILTGSKAMISIKFLSEQIIFSKSISAGEVLEGSQTSIEEVEDIWQFERNIRSTDPNWKIVLI